MDGWDVIAMGFGILLGSLGLLMFVVPVLWILSHYWHKVKLERLRLQQQTQGTDALRKEIENLRQQFQQLRETSAQFMLSSDSSLTALRDRLQRLEERLDGIEQRTLHQRL